MASLSYTDDNGLEQLIQLGDAPILIGRDPACDLATANPGVSRRHCRIAPLPTGGWGVTDLGSSHGTDVEGRRVQRARLKDGDLVMCGASFGVTFFEVP